MKATIVVLFLIITNVHMFFTQDSAAPGAGPTVRTTSGIVRGLSEGDIESFKGIPFAAPPVGEFRRRPPQPVSPWEGVRDAIKYGPNCAQAGWPRGSGSIAEGSSEDCLYLNIWKPARMMNTY